MAEALSGEKLSVGAPYFDSVAGPLAILLGILLAFGPLLSWRQEKRPIFRKLALPALCAATALVIAFLAMPQASILSRFGLALAAGLIPAVILPLIGRNPLRTPLATWGMVIAHLGAAVSVAGMAADSAFTTEKLTAVRLGETVDVGPWLVRFENVSPVAGPNWTALEAELRASRGGGVHVLRPQSRFFTDPPTETNEAAIQTVLGGQLYTVLGQADQEGRWQLRLWWKPMVTLIWLGGLLVGLGGLLALIGHSMRGWRRRRAAAL
jgi:cytochrome c-type biogenesis protein CcmF